MRFAFFLLSLFNLEFGSAGIRILVKGGHDKEFK